MVLGSSVVVRWVALTVFLFVGRAFADMHETAEAGFYASPEEVHPVLVGTEAPDGELKTIDGENTTLIASLGEKPGVLIFYRGNW